VHHDQRDRHHGGEGGRDGLRFDHGETDASPSPEPSTSRTIAIAAAVTAPENTAAQETAETADSMPPSRPTGGGGIARNRPRGSGNIHVPYSFDRSAPEQGEQQDDGNRRPKQPKQYCATMASSVLAKLSRRDGGLSNRSSNAGVPACTPPSPSLRA
jgi:hypothetical protein